jgi:hypothetical protein
VSALALKRRLMVMIAVNVLAVAVAMAAIVGYVAHDIAFLGPVFVAAIAAGVAAQVWFIDGFAKGGRPAGKA